MSALLIGISGASGSGKSTLAAALSDLLAGQGKRILTLAADRYFRDPLPRMISPFDGKEYPDWNSPDSFDASALLTDLLAAAESGEYDVIFTEGVTIFCHPALRDRFRLRIYVDASIEMRIYRRITRNVVTKGQTIEQIGEYYLKCARYREREFSLPSAAYADLRVDNEISFDAAAVWNAVRERLSLT